MKILLCITCLECLLHFTGLAAEKEQQQMIEMAKFDAANGLWNKGISKYEDELDQRKMLLMIHSHSEYTSEFILRIRGTDKAFIIDGFFPNLGNLEWSALRLDSTDKRYEEIKKFIHKCHHLDEENIDVKSVYVDSCDVASGIDGENVQTKQLHSYQNRVNKNAKLVREEAVLFIEKLLGVKIPK